MEVFLYNLFIMNKRAKKRLKETIQKELAERADKRNEQPFSAPARKVLESSGFKVKPEKKRG
jgi:hypothetical protein